MTQTATQITFAEFNQTVEAVAHDLRAEREHYGKTWEEVDDLLPEMCETEWSIYYSRAQELITALRVEDRELFDEAEQMHRDCFGSDGYDYSIEVRETQLAYCATDGRSASGCRGYEGAGHTAQDRGGSRLDRIKGAS